MGWERDRYYYRTITITIAGKRVREYAGTGERGEEAALRDAARAAVLATQRETDRIQREEIKAHDAHLDALNLQLRLEISALLIIAGYWHPKPGPWRKRRPPAER